MSNNLDALVAAIGIVIGAFAFAFAVVLYLRQRPSRVSAVETAESSRTSVTVGPVQTVPTVADPQTWAADLKVSGPAARRVGVITGDMKLVKGVDVWVNSENTDMQMPRINEGSTSAMIRLLGAKLDDAGKVCEDTILAALEEAVVGKVPVAPGSAFWTTSGELEQSHDVKYLIHVAAVQGEPGEGYRQIQDVGRCVTNALALADRPVKGRPQATSIIFPILGVGVGRGPLEPTVHALVNAAVSYLETTPDTSFSDVYFLGYWEHERDALFRAIDANDKLAPRFRQDITKGSRTGPA